MSFFNAAINYLADRRHLRQVILGAVGLLILGAAVLFGSDIEKLLNPPKSSAAYAPPPGAEQAWQVSSGLNHSRSSAQLVDVTSNGKRYLYLIGGIEKRQDSEGKQRISLVNSVERLPLGADGATLENAIWESGPLDGWGKMNSGHAGFKAFQYGEYLYVVSGDIHVPNVNDTSIDNPLLFSTIERLKLSDPNPTWQVYGLLTGVNFYPEILLDSSQLHVVGGIYGNPFTGASRYSWGPYLDILDPLSMSDDAAKWDSVYKVKPRIGDVGVSLPDGPPGAVIRTGLVTVIVEPDLSISSSAGVQAQQVTTDSSNFAKQLSDFLLQGKFATTVSEHYIIQLDSVPKVLFKGELGVNKNNTITTDYLGEKLSENWPTVPNQSKVGHLAHLRFEMYVGASYQSEATWAEVQPVPQGRYGFKLIKNDNEILLFGGASWNSPIGKFGALAHDYPFWVIDDDEEMYYQVVSSGYPPTIIYQYVGDIAYKYDSSAQSWQGTNGSRAGTTDGGLPRGGTDLSATYAFHDISGAKKGRAFFGFAKVESGSNNSEYVAVGGLESAGKSTSYPAFVHITITDRVERFTSSGWVSDTYIENDYSKPYNPSAIGINDQVVLFDGQTQFREGEGLVADPSYSELNNHVPDYRKPANNSVSMLSAGQWFEMAGFGDQGRGIPNLIFSAVLDVRSAATGGGTTVYIYKVGGSTPSLDYLPTNSTAVQILGPFTYGQGGKVDWSKSYLTVEPQDGSTADPPVLKADGSDYATVTLHAVDGQSQPVQVQDGTAVTLYTLNDDGTNRSFHPAIRRPDKPDWIEIVGYTTSPSGWGSAGTDYTNQFVLIDRGANEDGNAATSLGEAQFTISSRVPTNPQLRLKIHAINIRANPSLSLPTPIGDQPLIFTADGAPDDQYSTVEANPEQVEVGGTSTVTVTLKDHDQIPVVGYSVRIFTMASLPMGGPGGPITITPIIGTTDAEGKATFSVSADVALLVMVKARYAISRDFLAESPYEHSVMLNDSAFIEFKAFVVSLSPNHAFQGSQLPVDALGKGTHWQTGKTQAQFIAPATISFSLNTGGDIYSRHYVADGRTVIPLRLMAPEHPNKQVTLTVLIGGHLMSSDYVKTMTVTTDSEGVATFSYRVGAVPGISEIRAQVSGGPTDELWLIEEDPQLHPYELRVFADPSSLGGSVTQSRIQAVVYAYGERLQEEGIEISLDSDDSGTFSDDHPTTDANGIAQSMYNKDSSPGPVRIFATAIYGSNFVADQVLVSKSSASGNITFSGLGITDLTDLTINGVLIPNDAVVGDWTVQVTTASDLPGEPGEVVSAIFTVDSYNPPGGPVLTPPLSPSRGLRGETITLSVNGDGTHFFKGANTRSLVCFVPPANSPAGSENGIEVDDASLVVVSPIQLRVSINIREFAVTGLWDISVTTGSEVAIMPGIGDFFVSDESNYVLDIYSDAPNGKLPRDGNARAKITVFLAQIDPLNGQRTPLGNVDVTLVNDDAGTLTPKDDQGHTIIRTNNSGIGKGFAEATYKVDAGDINEPVTITASASPVEGIDVANFTMILKEITPYVGFTVSASPNALPLQGEPHIATLSFAGLPAGTHQVTFGLNGSPKGHIDSNTNPTTTTTRYIADTNRIPETVEFRAWTTLPGIGIVWSDLAFIEVGLVDYKYKLTSLTAVPNHVQAGSTETSTITAHLTYNNNPVVGWPIEFEIVNGGFGDYVTLPRVNTVNGNAVTTFVPGPLPANVIVRARAVGLSLIKEVIITKDVNQTIDPLRSSIWATPTHVPTSTDGSKYSVVTVLLRNNNDTPLSGKSVTLTSSRLQDTVRKGDGTAGNTGITDGTGRVKFRVSSGTTGTSMISASVDSYHPTTQIIFETGTLIAQRIKVVVPFQARDYDNEVLIYLKQNGSLSDADVFVNGYYIKNPRPNNELADLNATTLYLRPNTTYRVWVKGRYHLAKSQTFITGGTNMGANESPIAITFTELAVSDLLPNTRRVNNNDIPLPFHDNAVNVVDLPPIYSAWFQNADIPDFLRDFVINTADWLYWFSNYGNGEPGGPPPYDQRL
jgi:hypothetical protein